MENSKPRLDDISGPSRTEQTGDCGSSVSNPPNVSSASLTVGADSQVMKWLFYTIYILGLQSISDPNYFNYFFQI